MKAVITLTGTSEINKKLYHWVQLSKTQFYPKGGGQPSDKGTISGIQVHYVHKDLQTSEIYHCFENKASFNLGDEVILEVDANTRLLHSRLHSAGHLLADAVQKCFPELQPYQGNHYPEISYVRFKILSPLQDIETIKQQAEAEIKAWIAQDLKVEEKVDSTGYRLVKVYQNWAPCGGTHVKSLKEIGNVKISDISINKKDGIVTVKYSL